MISSTIGDKRRFVEIVKAKKKVLIVSDGLYYPKQEVGTRAWIITTRESLSYSIFEDNITLDEAKVQCSYRSEIGGLIGAISYWEKL